MLLVVIVIVVVVAFVGDFVAVVSVTALSATMPDVLFAVVDGFAFPLLQVLMGGLTKNKTKTKNQNQETKIQHPKTKNS